jgi:hypothetical protein
MLAPVIFAGVRVIQARRLLFDFLMPAEIFPVVLVGAGLLLWAAFRARSRQRMIDWSLVATVAILLASAVLAQVTGLASGETQQGGWQWALLLTLFAGFWLGLLGMGAGGALLVRDLY